MARPEHHPATGPGPLRRLLVNRPTWAGGTALLAASAAALTTFGIVGLHSHQTPTGSARSLPTVSGSAQPSARPDRSATSGPGTSTPQGSTSRHRRDDGAQTSKPFGTERAAKPDLGGPVTSVRIPGSGPQHYRRSHSGAKPESKHGRLVTYQVAVERDLPYRADEVAGFIHRVLNDRRSWGGHGHWRLQRVPPGHRADLHVYLVTPKTTDALCAPLDTEGRVSCFNQKRVVLNAKRWARGSKSYGSHVVSYRRNLVNHEFGHALGHDHKKCPGEGKKAPIMMQQTKGLHGCRPNPWPYP